jgi:2-iminobutanoate/2-iminopropanoate deaminase
MLSACSNTTELKRTPIMDGKVIGPYSSAQLVGNTLYVSGQICLNQETGQMENKDIESETRQVLTNLSHVLKTAGFTEDDVVSTTVYLKDMKDFAAMNTIYGGFFHEGNYPARCTVQIAALPRDAKIEISAIAVKSH